MPFWSKLNNKNDFQFQETMDFFGHSVVNGVKGGLQQTYIESMRSIVLPAYEKANAELFKQLYDTFNKGTIACNSAQIPFVHDIFHLFSFFSMKNLRIFAKKRC